MSIHLNWIAAERADTAGLLEELGLQEIGASNDEGGAAYACTVTPNGWLVLVGGSMKLKLERLLPSLSGRQTVLGGEVSDVVMVSGLQAWRGGARLWSVTHDPDAALENLEATGEPPEALSEIEARLAARQAAEQEAVDHMFEAPLELGARICGYRPDEPQPGPWMLLAPAKPRGGPVVSSLPAAIRAELWPAVAELGWTLAPIRLASNGRLYDASRIRDGRLQALRFLWRDDRRELEIIPSYAVVDGEAPDGRVLVSGGLYRNRPTLRQRIAAWVAGLGRPPAPYEAKVSAAVAEARADLPANDRFIGEDAINLA